MTSITLANLQVALDEGIMGKPNTLRVTVHYCKEHYAFQPRGYYLTACPILKDGELEKHFLSSAKSRLIEESARFSSKRLQEIARVVNTNSTAFDSLVVEFTSRPDAVFTQPLREAA